MATLVALVFCFGLVTIASAEVAKKDVSTSGSAVSVTTPTSPMKVAVKKTKKRAKKHAKKVAGVTKATESAENK